MRFHAPEPFQSNSTAQNFLSKAEPMTDQAPVTYTGPSRVLSGVQPSGALHLGNYLGALV